MEVIEREIAQIVAEVAELDPDEVVATATLADAGIDSLMAVEIAVEVERRYAVRFTEEELKEVTSFGSLVSLARSKLAASAR